MRSVPNFLLIDEDDGENGVDGAFASLGERGAEDESLDERRPLWRRGECEEIDEGENIGYGSGRRRCSIWKRGKWENGRD